MRSRLVVVATAASLAFAACGRSHAGGSGGGASGAPNTACGAPGGTSGAPSRGESSFVSLPSDPECDCVLVEGEFDCTFDRDLILDRMPFPMSCEDGKDYVVRTSCRGGSAYSWTLEGDSYEMQWDPGGPGYLMARGHVAELCHVEAP